MHDIEPKANSTELRPEGRFSNVRVFSLRNITVFQRLEHDAWKCEHNRAPGTTKRTLGYRRRAETRRHSAALFQLTWGHTPGK